MIPTLLQVQSVGAAGRMGQKHIYLSGIPVILILWRLKLPHPQSGFLQGLKDSRPVVLVVVEHKCRLPLKGFHQLHKRLQFAVMDLMDLPVLVVNSPIGQLQQLITQGGRTGYTNVLSILWQLQNHLTLQLTVCFESLCVQLHRYLMVRDIRKLQVILRLHADADIAYLLQNTFLTPGLSLVTVHHAVCSALIRLEIPFPEMGVPFPQTLAAVQQEYLGP